MAQLQRSPVVPLFLLVLGLAALGGFLIWAQSVPGPSVEFARPPQSIGRTATFQLTATARRGGVRWIEARLRRGADEVVLGRVEYEGAAENRREVTLSVDATELQLTEGDAFLNIYGADGFWRLRSRADRPLYSAPVRIDLTPPPLHVLSATRYPAQGGAAICVVQTESEAEVEIQVGDRAFAAVTPAGASERLRVGLYAVPWDFPPTGAILATATDPAGNASTRELPVVLKTTKFERGTVEIREDFVRRKAPELLAPADINDDVTAMFVKINRDMRAAAAARKLQIGQQSSASQLWSRAFRQPRNTRVFSNFAESRDYRIDGRTVDTQLHLGFDLASVRQAPIPAANAGRVVFAGPLGIYGNTVVVDHGWGLQTLYAHCSSLAVDVGAEVSQGQEIGRTGSTGLAVGDHLHYEVLVRGVPVSPLQWWDGQWVADHIVQVLRDGGIQTASR